MSDLIPSVIPLTSGLDLSSPKMLAEPGSLLECLNYELVDFLGYRRISGYSRYDGNVSLVDIPEAVVYKGRVTITGGTPPSFDTNIFFEDADGNKAGFLFYGTEVILPGPDEYEATFISFTGSKQVTADFGTWSFKSFTDNLEQTTITQAQMQALDTALRGLVDPLPYTAVGLQWHRNNLYAVVPQLMLPYQASTNNQVVNYTIGATLTTGLGAGTAQLRDKIVTVPAGVSTPETGYFIVLDLGSGSLDAPTSNTYAFGGAVSVGVGAVYHQTTALKGMASTACSVWKAQRPSLFNLNKLFAPTGWFEQTLSYTAKITLSGVTTDIKAIRRGNTETEATYWFNNGVNTYEVQVLDWFVESGTYEDGDAVISLQFSAPVADITTAFDLFSDAGATVKIADVIQRMSLNYLPGYPQLKPVSSRYQFINANFYASDDTDAVYGANGASRAFVFGGATELLSFIYTQADATADTPRHIENFVYHLALGFRPGSVQLSVAGQPTNFDGALGASERGVGDILTGLMTLSGTTLGVFCSSSIHSITGTSVDNFDLQVVAPKTGCVEYSLADIGEPVYLDARGICTISTSANYGDFVDGRLSEKVSSFVRRRLKSGIIGTNNSAGVACAMPVRNKNQYRVFFNDGSILTTTFKGKDAAPGFTLQKYFLNQSAITDRTSTIVPIAWTSEVDDGQVERIFVSHYNEDAVETSAYVYELECGESFDGKYIPHECVVNWYYSENPSQFQTLHAVRMHGLSKGVANLNVQVAGAQNDLQFGANGFSTTVTPINLPRQPTNITSEFQPVTNRTDIAGRGLAIQLKFSGSNTDLNVIEPSHVLQVLVTYSTPDGAFDL